MLRICSFGSCWVDCCVVLSWPVLCCVVVLLCCAVLCCAVLCCAVLCCAVLCCAVLCCAVLCWLCCLQYCRMAADPVSALLLQPTCRAVASMHNTLVGAILGPMFVLSRDRPAACSGMAMSARVLGWYAQAMYGLFVPIAAYGGMEWRLKAHWVKDTLGKQLVYGPLRWPQSQPSRTSTWTSLHTFVRWSLATAVCWVLLWEGVTWVVPQLPLMPCQSCEQAGTCMPITCGECCA